MFKAGDKIVCINNIGKGHRLNVGQVYTVKRYVSRITGESIVWLVGSGEGGFRANRFRLASKERVNKICFKPWNKPYNPTATDSAKEK